MDVQLLPLTGVGPIRLGTPVGEARATATEWGLTAVAEDAEPGQIVFRHEASDMDFVLGFAKDLLTHVEVFRFHNEDADIRVTLDGVDVFRTRIELLQNELQEMGHALEEDDMGADILPDLNIIFANESSYPYPRDPENGSLLYYDYVLVAEHI
jgi:hypothetical protein